MEKNNKIRNLSIKDCKSVKSCRGITLVALVATIIVLIILAALIIDVSVDGKLFDKAHEVVNKSEELVTEHGEMSDEVRNLYK